MKKSRKKSRKTQYRRSLNSREWIITNKEGLEDERGKSKGKKPGAGGREYQKKQKTGVWGGCDTTGGEGRQGRPSRSMIGQKNARTDRRERWLKQGEGTATKGKRKRDR